MFSLPSRALLPCLTAFYALNFMDRSVLGAVSESMRLDLGLSDAQMGLIHSLLLISLIFLIIPCSLLNDLKGRRRMLGVSALLWSVGVASTGLAAGLGALIGARLMCGFNDAFAGSGGSAWLGQHYPPEQRGRVLGIYQMSVPLGMALGTLWGGFTLWAFGSWRMAFLAFLVPGLALALLIPRLPDRQETPPLGEYLAGLRQVARQRSLLLISLASGGLSIAVFAYQAWTPTLLKRVYGLGDGTVGLVFASFMLSAALGPLIGGFLADLWQRRDSAGRLKAACLCLVLAVCTKLFFFYMLGKCGLGLLVVMGIIDGLLTMATTPINFAVTMEVVPARYGSIAVGLMGTLGFLAGGAWGPLLAGVFSDYFGGGAEGLRLALMLLMGIWAVSFLFYAMAVPYYRKERIR